MSDEFGDLVQLARQVIQAETAMGGEFLPIHARPLPAVQPSRGAEAGASAGAASPAPDAAARPQPSAGTTFYQSGAPGHARPARTAPATAHALRSGAPAPQGASPVASVPPTGPLSPPVGASMSRQEKLDALAALDKEIRACSTCQLHKLRRQAVPGEGDPEAAIFFVGEAPGEDEDAQGRPFVGRSGQLLTKMIEAMGLDRSRVFIANIVKCRPPDNRTPEPAETLACRHFLIRQLQVVAPKVIVTMGNPATQGLLATKVGITLLRGNWQALGDIGAGLEGTPVMPTFHPAFVLRNYTPEVRGKVWDDLQKVMELAGLKKPAK